MKFKEVLSACKYPTWFKPHYDWKLEGDRVVPVSDVDLTLDTEVHVDYFWYDHLNPELRKAKIDEAIEAHDWETYKKWRDYVEEDDPYNPLCYFPNEVTISADGGYIGTVYLFSQEVFNLIEHSEHECG